jgi:hypothetical protein
LPLLRESSSARIVIVSSGVGSLATNADPAYPYHGFFDPVYNSRDPEMLPSSLNDLWRATVSQANQLQEDHAGVGAALSDNLSCYG